MQKSKCSICCRNQETRARVHVIYTGGTIGMMRNADGVLAPIQHELPKRLRDYPNCHDKSYKLNKNEDLLVLPHVEGTPYRVLYDLVEYAPLLDSSCMNMSDWQRIAKDIGKSYNQYDGFVILHGTDTMAYTASALSFMLQNLGKPVVITGAQIPIFEMRTDGRDNFIGSIVLAGNFDIPEVVLYFGNRVMRGCRTTKISAESFHAFDTPNHPPLGEVGVNVDINSRLLFRSCSLECFSVHDKLETQVGLLLMYPGITPAVLRAFLSEPMRGVVIQSFGAGNVPSNNAELLAVLREAINRGMLIVNISQCPKGSVAEIYETGAWMSMGVVAGSDMTKEAAFTKLAYVLAKPEWDLANKKKVMQLSIRGELTTNKVAKVNDIDLIEGVARTLRLSTAKEREQMCATFYPAIVAASIVENDVEKLKALKQYGADLCDKNCDGRTALHLACFMGKVVCVEYLLAAGCATDVADRFSRTPLHEAIDTDNRQIIRLLLKHGARLQDVPEVQAEVLRALAERAQLERLESYRLAGGNLMQADRTGRTALHYACQLGRQDVVMYLISHYAHIQLQDELGLTPLDYAQAANHEHIVCLLHTCEQCS
ncbi:CG8526 [Drosophila busckii]|uniref:asparaginase n=1 Tax=Drosophila busckii TaxID=30019 RepID=A0A0M3QXR7_DROBS|nr:L-asparaginase 1 [Drosophila busckii]ALC46339.1 CG8526 [Drosophila busckii]